MEVAHFLPNIECLGFLAPKPMKTFKREAGLAVAGDRLFIKSGTAVKVFDNHDFFKIAKVFQTTKKHKFSDWILVEVPCLIHSHPPGCTELSRDDVETFTGLCIGLGRFVAIVVTSPKTIKSWEVCLEDGKVRIKKSNWMQNFINKLIFRKYWKRVWDESCK